MSLKKHSNPSLDHTRGAHEGKTERLLKKLVILEKIDSIEVLVI